MGISGGTVTEDTRRTNRVMITNAAGVVSAYTSEDGDKLDKSIDYENPADYVGEPLKSCFVYRFNAFACTVLINKENEADNKNENA